MAFWSFGRAGLVGLLVGLVGMVVGWFSVVNLVGLVVDSFGGWIVGWLVGWLVWWLDCNSKLETEIGEAGLGSYDAGNRHPLVSQTFRLNLTLNLSQNFNRAFCSDFANRAIKTAICLNFA